MFLKESPPEIGWQPGSRKLVVTARFRVMLEMKPSTHKLPVEH
jgi:hypothetical protein